MGKFGHTGFAEAVPCPFCGGDDCAAVLPLRCIVTGRLIEGDELLLSALIHELEPVAGEPQPAL